MDEKVRFLIDFIGYTHGQAIDAPTDQMKLWARIKAKHQGKQICCFLGDPEDIHSKAEEEEAKAKEEARAAPSKSSMKSRTKR